MAKPSPAELDPKRGSVQASGTVLSYLEWGSQGRHALLLHGITSNARTWWRVGPRLLQAGFHVFAFDMPGHGYSGETADHNIESLATLIANAGAALGMQRMLLVGHSWGGAVALAMAARAAEIGLERVILIDPALRLTAESGKTRIPVFTKGIGSSANTLSPGIAAANPDWHEQDVHWKAEAVQQCRMEAVVGFFTKSGDWDYTPKLAQVKVPLLLLIADPAGTIIDPDTRTAAESNLPASARLQVVRGTTHNMYRGAGYEPTLAAIAGWLGGR